MADKRRIKRTQSMAAVDTPSPAEFKAHKSPPPQALVSPQQEEDFGETDGKLKRRFRMIFRPFRKGKTSGPESPGALCDTSAPEASVSVLTLNGGPSAKKSDNEESNGGDRRRLHTRRRSLSRTTFLDGSESDRSAPTDSPSYSPRPRIPQQHQQQQRTSPVSPDGTLSDATPPAGRSTTPGTAAPAAPNSTTHKRRKFLRRGFTSLTFGKTARHERQLVLVRVKFDRTVKDANRRTPHEFNFIVDASVSSGHDVLNTIIAAKDLPRDVHYSLTRAATYAPVDLRASFSVCVPPHDADSGAVTKAYNNDNNNNNNIIKNCLPDTVELLLRAERNRSASAICEGHGPVTPTLTLLNTSSSTSLSPFSATPGLLNDSGGRYLQQQQQQQHYHLVQQQQQHSEQELRVPRPQVTVPLLHLPQPAADPRLVVSARRCHTGRGTSSGGNLGGIIGGITISDKYRRVQAARSNIRMALLCATCTMAAKEHLCEDEENKTALSEPLFQRDFPELVWQNDVFARSSVRLPLQGNNNSSCCCCGSCNGGGDDDDDNNSSSNNNNNSNVDGDDSEGLCAADYVMVPPRNRGPKSLEMPIPTFIARYTGSVRRRHRPVAIWLHAAERPLAVSAHHIRGVCAQCGVDVVAAEYRGAGVRARYGVWSDIKGAFLLDDLAALVRHVTTLWNAPYVICGERTGALLALSFALSLASAQDSTGEGKGPLARCKELLAGVALDNVPLTDDIMDCATRLAGKLSCSVACTYAEGTPVARMSSFAKCFSEFAAPSMPAWKHTLGKTFPDSIGGKKRKLPALAPPENNVPGRIAVFREWLRRRGYDPWQACVLEAKGICSIEQAACTQTFAEEAKYSLKMLGTPWCELKKVFSCYTRVLSRAKRNKKVSVKKKPSGWVVFA